jgi:hypothetical protein
MHRLFARLPHVLLASAVALSAVAVAAPRDAASGQATGKRMYKPYTAAAQSVPCAATEVQPVKVASDPEEGGQVARTANTKPTVSGITVTKKVDTASTKLMDSAPAASAPCAPVQH